MSYASIPVNASIDWVTWKSSTVFPVVIPALDNIFAIFYISKFIIIEVSVVGDRGRG